MYFSLLAWPLAFHPYPTIRCILRLTLMPTIGWMWSVHVCMSHVTAHNPVNMWRSSKLKYTWFTYTVNTHMVTQSCFTFTVWTFFCSRVLKKVKLFKPLPFPLKILFGRISSQSFLLIFSSILRQITPNPNFLRKFRISNSWKHCGRVQVHSVSSSYTVWTSFVLRSTLRMLHKITCVSMCSTHQSVYLVIQTESKWKTKYM